MFHQLLYLSSAAVCMFQVYWENGAQIVSPHDKGIAKAIEENLEPWPESWNTQEALKSPLLKDPYQDINTQYFKAIQKHCHHRCSLNNCLLTFKTPGEDTDMTYNWTDYIPTGDYVMTQASFFTGT